MKFHSFEIPGFNFKVEVIPKTYLSCENGKFSKAFSVQSLHFYSLLNATCHKPQHSESTSPIIKVQLFTWNSKEDDPGSLVSAVRPTFDTLKIKVNGKKIPLAPCKNRGDFRTDLAQHLRQSEANVVQISGVISNHLPDSKIVAFIGSFLPAPIFLPAPVQIDESSESSESDEERMRKSKKRRKRVLHSCNCKTGCKTKRCSCKSTGNQCNSKCHPNERKGCENLYH